jgi:hypothetical protein
LFAYPLYHAGLRAGIIRQQGAGHVAQARQALVCQMLICRSQAKRDKPSLE